MISFTVSGDPQTKGSAKAFRHKSTGKIIVWNDNPKTKTWAALVAWKAKQAMAGRPPLTGPVRVVTVFRVAKPRTSKKAAPRQDGDKLTRALWDALSGVVFVDDSQVTEWGGRKEWGEPGVSVEVEEVRP